MEKIMRELKAHIAQKILDAIVIKEPIDHIVIDDFLPKDLAQSLSDEFGDYDSDHWHKYSNSIEEKRTCNQWNLFEKHTYLYFQTICSEEVNIAVSEKFGIDVQADYGLHGGGQHIHSKMGNLNPHLDYAIHPKIGAERRLNAIYYLTDKHEETDGGHFGLWGNRSTDEPGKLIKEYAPIFNRLVFFNTSQNTWHGLSRVYAPKDSRYRKSLAAYHVSEPRDIALSHTRALFAPREDQQEDKNIIDQIKARVSESNHKNAYVTKKCK